MDKFFSTKQVASILILKPDYISKAVWQERIEAPAKSPSGNYLWMIKDIERASWVLLRKPYKPADSKDNGKD
ncbi:hypothetical protein ACFL1G_10570 [Planctomycetota bacterium]